MAARNLTHPLSLARDMVILSGKIDGNGSSALTQSTANTQGFTITRTGVGTYRATLADKWNKLLGCFPAVQEDTPDQAYRIVRGATSLSSKTVDFTVYVDDAVSGIPAATDVPATGEISIIFVLSNTAQVPSRG